MTILAAMLLSMAAQGSAPAQAANAAAAGVSDTVLDCPMDATTPGLAQRIADLVEPGNGIDDIGEPRLDEMLAIVRACADEHDVPKAQLEPYAMYYFSRLMRVESERKLVALGIPPDAIHRAFGIRDDDVRIDDFRISKAQSDDLMTLLDAAGVDVAKLPDGAFNLVGVYAAARVAERNFSEDLQNAP